MNIFSFIILPVPSLYIYCGVFLWLFIDLEILSAVRHLFIDNFMLKLLASSP